MIVLNKYDLLPSKSASDLRQVKKEKEQEETRKLSYIVFLKKYFLLLTYSSFVKFEDDVRSHLKFMSFVPVVKTSATTGYQIAKALDTAVQVFNDRSKKVKEKKKRALFSFFFLECFPNKEEKLPVYFFTLFF